MTYFDRACYNQVRLEQKRDYIECIRAVLTLKNLWCILYSLFFVYQEGGKKEYERTKKILLDQIKN